jgi:DNA-binding MarR family transcriptional regulator
VTQSAQSSWTLLSNHGHILIAVSRSPDARIRDLSAEVGITDRAAQIILRDLEDAGYVTKNKVGRRNHYHLNPESHLRHPAESMVSVTSLLKIFERP